MNDKPTTAVATQQKPSALVAMANRYNVDPTKLLDTLKATVFKNATNEQLMALVIVSNEYGLNPFTKQIYAFPDKSGGIVPVISVDGWLALMNSHELFDGIQFSYEEGEDGKPVSCTATLHVKGRNHPTSVTEYLRECHRNTDPWNKSPHRMLRHRATIQAIRVGMGYSAMDEDEADRLLKGAVNTSVAEDPLTTIPAKSSAKREDKVIKPDPASAEPPTPEKPADKPADEPPMEGETPLAGEQTPVETDPDVIWKKAVTDIMALMRKDDVNEAQVIAFCKKEKRCGRVCEEVAMMATDRVIKLISDWPTVIEQIRAMPTE